LLDGREADETAPTRMTVAGLTKAAEGQVEGEKVVGRFA